MAAVVYILAALYGLCVGSFLNVVIYRVPEGMSVAVPASHCTSCGYVLRWYDNIPVISYLMLGGKCRKCKTHISVRYTIVEILNMLLWLLSVWIFWERDPVYACAACLVCSVLICIFFIDLEHMLIFDRFLVILAAVGAATAFLDGYTRPVDHLIGAAVGGFVFAGLYYGAVLLLKKEGLGWGDVKLAAVAGLLLGWQKLLLAMLIASVSGSIVLIALTKCRKAERGTEYPFAPFIVSGMLVSLLVGAEIIAWYVDLLVG